jgi:hypothetical protein
MKKLYPLFVLCFLINYSNAQNWTWDTLTLQGAANLVKDSDNNIYAFFPNKNLLSKYQVDGSLIWQKTFPIEIKLKRLICVGGLLYLTGTFTGSTIFDSKTLISEGESDIFIAKLTSGGSTLWAKQISSKGTDSAGDVCIYKGKLLVTGSTTDSTNFFAGPIFPKTKDSDLFIATYDLAGNFETSFFSTFLSTLYYKGGAFGYEIEPDNNNDLIVLAGISGKIQIDTVILDDAHSSYLIKLDSAFHVKWHKKVTSYGRRVEQLKINSSDQIIYVYNDYQHYSDNGRLYMLSSDGQTGTEYYNTGKGHVRGIDIDSADNIYFAAHRFKDPYSTPMFYMHYGMLRSDGLLNWIITDSAYSMREGFDIIKCNNDFFVSGSFYDSLSLQNNFFDSQSGFLATFQMSDVIGIENIYSDNELHAIIYPNPSTALFNIKLNGNNLNTVCIYDLLGNCIYTKPVVRAEEYQIDLSDKARGIYFMKIFSDKGSITNKIILN